MLDSRFSSAFPPTNIPEKNKDEAWYKKFIQAIVSDFQGSNTYEDVYTRLYMSYLYYDGLQSSEGYDFLQEAENGDVLPAKWFTYNKIKTRVDGVVSEMALKGYDIEAVSVNKDAQSRKLKKKQEMLAKRAIRKDLAELEQISGVPTALTDNIPETEDEILAFMENSYKEDSEKVIETALNYLIKRYQWKYERNALFRDIMICNRAFCWTYIESGVPKYKRLDPRYVVVDPYCKNDFLTDATYLGYVEFLPLGTVVEKYDLNKDEIEQVKGSAAQILRNFRLFLGDDYDRAGFGSNRFGGASPSGDSLKVVIFHGFWVDQKPLRYKENYDKYGTAHLKKVPVDKSDPKKGMIKRQVKVWRKGTLIGGQVMRDYGTVENMVRSVDDIADVKCPITCLIPNFVNYTGISTVDQLKSLQDLKDITMYQLQLQMARAGAKGFFYDISLIPDGMEFSDVLKYIKTTGIAVYNPYKDGIPRQPSQLSQFDLTISSTMNQYINISMMVDSEMDAISGINSARQGITPSASTAVGVTQQALAQSAVTTHIKFDLFNSFSESIMTKLAALCKMSMRDKDRWGMILGDSGVDFINNDLDLDLDDYAVFLKERPDIMNDKGKFNQTLDIALQQGAISLVDYLKLSLDANDDLRGAIQRFEDDVERRAQEAQQAQQKAMLAQQEAAAQAAQQLQSQRAQSDMMKEQLKGERQSQIENQRSENKREEIVLDKSLNQDEI